MWINDRWKEMGFQSKDPRTDFRGGGHLSLLALIYMIEEHPQEFNEMVAMTRDEEDKLWLTAISSINITNQLIIYFYMNKGDAPP